MTFDIHCEKNGLRATLLIITNTTATHSAFQEISKEHLERYKLDFQSLLEELLTKASIVAKS